MKIIRIHLKLKMGNETTIFEASKIKVLLAAKLTKIR